MASGPEVALSLAPPFMPTYEYHCEKCGQNFDLSQSMRDEPLKVCPKEHCRRAKWGRGKVKRLLGTGAGLIFKGSGFYITDYRSSSYKEGAKKEAPSPVKSEGAKASGTKDAVSNTPPAPDAGKKPKKD